MELVRKLFVKILLTGASGFLGSALASFFLDSGYQLALLLRPTSDLRRLNGKDIFFDLGFCETDCEIDAFVQRANPDVVIHTACSYGREGESALQVMDANIRLGLAIIESCIKSQRKITFINAATALNSQISLYALTKKQFSELAKFLVLQKNNQVQFINVLLQHIYGPWDDSSKFTTYVLNTCFKNNNYLELTKGEQVRDFIYIKDVVTAYHTLLNQDILPEKFFQVEVGSGVGVTIKNFVETVHQLTESRTNLLFGALPYRNDEVMNCCANIKTMNSFGWHPQFSLESGLKEIINFEFKK